MSNKELSNEESLALIADMIGQAKRNLAKGGSFYFLLWGWVVMLANLGHYLIATFDWYEYPYIVWVSTVPAAIASMVYGFRRDAKASVRSHLDTVYSQIWLAVFIGALIILFFTGNVLYNINAIILTFAGVGTYISGMALRFKPLVFGGMALWIASIIAFNLNPIDQYLVGTVGIFAGYLVPGYLLKRAESEPV